jgi:selenocysteine lyase/cysteine desulfurase
MSPSDDRIAGPATSPRPLRVSPHLWTTDQDVDRLAEALTMAAEGTVAS